MRPRLVASILVSSLDCGFAIGDEPTVVVSGERRQNNLISAVELKAWLMDWEEVDDLSSRSIGRYGI